MHIKRVGVALMAAAMIGTGVFSGVSASGLGSILGGIVKVGGIGFLVDKYGEFAEQCHQFCYDERRRRYELCYKGCSYRQYR